MSKISTFEIFFLEKVEALEEVQFCPPRSKGNSAHLQAQSRRHLFLTKPLKCEGRAMAFCRKDWEEEGCFQWVIFNSLQLLLPLFSEHVFLGGNVIAENWPDITLTLICSSWGQPDRTFDNFRASKSVETRFYIKPIFIRI